jgi:hypothetical protein
LCRTGHKLQTVEVLNEEESMAFTLWIATKEVNLPQFFIGSGKAFSCSSMQFYVPFISQK